MLLHDLIKTMTEKGYSVKQETFKGGYLVFERRIEETRWGPGNVCVITLKDIKFFTIKNRLLYKFDEAVLEKIVSSFADNVANQGVLLKTAFAN